MAWIPAYAGMTLFFSFPAAAIESVTVMADDSLNIAVTEIARAYARDFGVVVNISYLPQATQQVQILEGGAADLVITPHGEWINDLKLRGMVDIYSLAEVAKKDATPYNAVVVAGENMTPARTFLEYLKSTTAQQIFRRNGL